MRFSLLTVLLLVIVVAVMGHRRKLRTTSKSMTSQIGLTVYILPNIAQSKDIQAMKYGQLMEYNMRNHAENYV